MATTTLMQPTSVALPMPLDLLLAAGGGAVPAWARCLAALVRPEMKDGSLTGGLCVEGALAGGTACAEPGRCKHGGVSAVVSKCHLMKRTGVHELADKLGRLPCSCFAFFHAGCLASFRCGNLGRSVKQHIDGAHTVLRTHRPPLGNVLLKEVGEWAAHDHRRAAEHLLTWLFLTRLFIIIVTQPQKFWGRQSSRLVALLVLEQCLRQLAVAGAGSRHGTTGIGFEHVCRVYQITTSIG